MIDKQKIYGIDTVEVTNQLWVLSMRYRAFLFWDQPEAFDLNDFYFPTISLKSKDPYLTPDKEYTGKDAVRMLKTEYLTEAKKSIGLQLEKQAKIYSDWMHSIINVSKNNGSTTGNS